MFQCTNIMDEESYDGNISKVDEKDAEVIPDVENDVQMEDSKPTGANTLTENEGQEETNKEDGDQIAKPADKKPV